VYADLLSSEIGADGLLIDIGSKDGAIASELQSAFDADVVAVDPTFEDTGESDVSFLRADGCRLPFENDTADTIISNMVIEHISDEEQLFSEASRILAPDGVFIVIFPNRVWPFDGHDYPPGFVWIPRSLGETLTCVFDLKPEYYRDSMHPTSSVVSKRKLRTYFGSVQYRSDQLLSIEYEDSRRGELLSKVEGPLRTAFGVPGLSGLLEGIFPVAIYVVRNPVN
jgi:SAM-dependent methyltransferase